MNEFIIIIVMGMRGGGRVRIYEEDTDLVFLYLWCVEGGWNREYCVQMLGGPWYWAFKC